MNTIKLLEILRESSLVVFKIKDIARIINKSEAYSSLVMFRLKKRSLITEIEKGKYCLKGTNILAVASNLVFPSYISFLSALSFYKATTQIPAVIEVVSPKIKKEIIFENYKIKFYKLEKKKIFGYTKSVFDEKSFFIAEKEKLMLDCLSMKQIYLQEVFNILKSFKFDKEKLIDYAFRLNSKIVLKRLGYLLKEAKYSFYTKLAKKRSTKRYEPLNPLLPIRGEKDMQFRIILNEDLNAE
ncbi:hypothetical protein HY837_01705 [archaeon]|nr:hypothetical protein [archaeon]